MFEPPASAPTRRRPASARSSQLVDDRERARFDHCAGKICATLQIEMVALDVHQKLLSGAFSGSMRAVKEALAAGANIDGRPELSCAPIAGATIMNEVSMISFLIDRRADPNGPVYRELPCPLTLVLPPEERFVHDRGQRPLHIAIVRGNVEVVRLLKRAGADPNAIDNRGRTPLLTACECLEGSVEIVKLLLEMGADPALAENEHGCTPLHLAAQNGHIGFVDMLYRGAPLALNTYANTGETPLFLACAKGHEIVVSRLLSLGAMQVVPPDRRGMLPLAMAVKAGFMGVVRVMIDGGVGIKAIGGSRMFPNALYSAVRYHQARILWLLLGAHGEDRRSEFANADLNDQKLLHCGAGFCSVAAVSVLLASGAEEAARDAKGRLPQDIIGADPRRGRSMSRGQKLTVRRMLERGPAYRARSWTWPTEGADGAYCDDDGDAVISSPPAVRTFRPESDRSFFAKIVSRWAVFSACS